MAAETYATNEELLQDILNSYSEEDPGLIERVWDFAVTHYSAFRHPTGKPFLQYALRVAKILVDIGSTPIVIAAAIVFPPLPQYKEFFPEIEDALSKQPELIRLVEELFTLSRFDWDIWPENSGGPENKLHNEVLLKMFLLAIEELGEDDPARRMLKALHFQKREKQVENIIRMLLANVTDVRVLIIKLADRLYFMKLLKYLSNEEKKTIQSIRQAHVSLAVYASLADRLGLWQLKSELEDMSFRLLDMNAYKAIADQLAAKKDEREGVVNDIIPLIEEALEKYDVIAEVSGRAKHIYSIHKKMEARQLKLEQINDLLGIRIIIGTITECYYAQDIILDKWLPIRSFYDGEIGRDWITHPKANGYQSLHTTIEVNGKIVEIQIRTWEMHEKAEYGTASEHWRYKDPKIYRKGKTPRVTKEKDVNWGKQLGELRKSLTNQQEATDLIQGGLLKDRIYVITPSGHVLDFPQGSTPLDFAYRIHSDLGNRYAGAKVDGHIVRLDYHMNNGEIVELIASRPRPGPNPDWLDVNKDEEDHSNYIFARTSQTRSKIRTKLKENGAQRSKSHK
jgi:GTP pyrophosphokinase